MRRSVGYAIAAFIWSLLPARADVWGITSVHQAYFDPIIADPRQASVHITALGFSNPVPFAQKKGVRRVWDIGLGAEIPIVGRKTGKTNSDIGATAGEWGIGAWIPVSFHMMEDFKDESNPILNTDYRFGGMMKFQYGLGTWKWADAGQTIGAKLQMGHESTHIGDEFTIGAIAQPGFRRVNVSYEYWEMGASYELNRAGQLDTTDLNNPKDKPGRRAVIRGGFIGLLKPKDGWFSSRTLDPVLIPADSEFCDSPAAATSTLGRQICLARSRNNSEIYVQTEFRPQYKSFKGTSWFASVDARRRAVYDYVPVGQIPRDEYKWSYNLVAGFVSVGPRAIPFHYFARFYHGVNPHGQFRSQKNFNLFGLGIQIPIF